MSDAWMVVERTQGLHMLDGLARERGWALETDHTRTFYEGSQRLWTVREGVRAGRVDDHLFGVSMVLVLGDDALAGELRRLPGVVPTDELLRRAAGDTLPGSLDALRALVVWAVASNLAHGFEAILPLLDRWSRHPSEPVRRAVMRVALRAQARALPVIAARREDPELGDAYRRLYDIVTSPNSDGVAS